MLIFSEMFDMKMKYDESENLLIRATRTFTDKMSEMFGKLDYERVTFKNMM